MESFLTIELPITLALVGMGILVAGLHGRRIDDHPLCPRCGFDLFGKPNLTNIICPECGHAIASQWDARIGHRQRRRGLIYLATALLLPSLLMLSITATLAARGVKWIQIAPLGWLIKTGDARDASARDASARAAIEELDHRIASGKLSTQQLNEVLDHALAVQGDVSGIIDPQHVSPPPNEGLWYSLVEEARKAGKVSDDRWQHYAEQSVVFLLAIRPHVRRGDAIPFVLRQWQRCQKSWFNPSYRIALKIDGIPVSVAPPNYRPGSSSFIDTQLNWFVEPTDPIFAKLQDGEHEVRAVVDTTVPGSNPSNPMPPVRGSAHQTIVTHFSLEPSDRETVTMVSDPKLAAVIHDWLRVDALDFYHSQTSDGEIHLRLSADAMKKLPLDLAFRVVIRAQGKEWPLGLPICFQRGFALGSSYARVRNFTADTVDVILRSDPSAAARTTDIEEIWDGELVLKDVKVNR